MKKRKYLYRLAAVMLLVLIFPIVLFFNFFWKHAFEEMEQSNEGFYERVLDSCVSSYEKKLLELETFAAAISATSREPGSTLWRGQEALTENTYQVYMAINELKEKYSRNDVSEWGIYFYDIDKIITPEFAYTSEQFIRKYTGSNVENEQMAEFFGAENYAAQNMLFATTNTAKYYDGYLLVGFCTRIGKSNDKVLFFYLLSPEYIGSSLAIKGGEGVEYYLLDREQNHILLVWGDSPQENVQNVLSGEEWRHEAGVKQKVLYVKDSSYAQLSIATYVSQDSLQDNIIGYAFDMRRLMLVTAVVLLVICAGSLYISYRPVYELTNDLEDYVGSEFEMIRNMMIDKESRIVEQEMLIMDLLVNHLIYGVPISEKRIQRLGIKNSENYYCVFFVEGYVFVNSEAEKLTVEMEKDLGVRIFVTDWQGENSSVIIVFMKEPDALGVQAKLAEWLKECYIADGFIYVGKVVDKLDGIQLSLRSCFNQMKKKDDMKQTLKIDEKSLTSKEERQKRLKEEILAYLEIHYRDSDLSQVQVADLFRISNYTLSRLFKNQVGVGFAEYLVAKRLEYAKELLLATSHSVKDISVMAGFSSENYFSRTFKLYEGVSPSSFRNK